MTDPQDQKVQRRLAAVFAADVVGFSVLMGQDEEGTLAAIKSLRREVIEPKVGAHHGRVVKTTGDGILVEFSSPIEAVRCAVEVQQALAARTSQALQLRIGINLGDIILDEDGDIYGDGVNVAARLEQIAEPGAIWVSGKVYEEVRDKLSYTFADRGEQTVKNIARPVRVYSLLGEKRQHGSPAEKPSKPSIAVLPFANADDNPGQRYFSDGFTEDIIVELSRFRQLAVVSGSTSFRFRNADVRSLGKTLGVLFILEGGVRRRGRQIRISCQLLDALSGEHIWTERFDRDEQEIFEVQDQLVQVIVGTLVGRVQAAGAERARSKPPANLAAYECVLRGNALPMGDRQAEAEARRWYRKAIRLDPGYGRAYAKLAHYLQLEWFRDVNAPDALLKRAFEMAQKADALAPNDPVCVNILGWIYLQRREFALAEQYYQRALDLNPNDPEQIAYTGVLKTFLGESDQALAWFERARLLDPFFDPSWYWPLQGVAHFIAHRFEPAISALSHSPTMPMWVKAYLAAAHALVGRSEQSREFAALVIREAPTFSASGFANKEPYRREEDSEILIRGLRSAGFPG